MWILWGRKCDYWVFHITHAKKFLTNHLSSTRDLTRFFGICDVEKPYSHFLLTVFSHCLKKHKRLLHSKITSKTQIQMTSFTKYSQVTGQVHGWLLHSLKITLSTFRLDRVLSKWLFFIILVSFMVMLSVNINWR